MGGGDIAFLTGHAPFVGALDIATVSMAHRGWATRWSPSTAASSRCQRRPVTILSDVAELAGQIDVERAREAQDGRGGAAGATTTPRRWRPPSRAHVRCRRPRPGRRWLWGPRGLTSVTVVTPPARSAFCALTRGVLQGSSLRSVGDGAAACAGGGSDAADDGDDGSSGAAGDEAQSEDESARSDPELFEGDDFYEVPDPLPEGTPATSSYPKVIDEERHQGLALYRVMYLSESLPGDPIAVTGTVSVPEGRGARGRPH